MADKRGLPAPSPSNHEVAKIKSESDTSNNRLKRMQELQVLEVRKDFVLPLLSHFLLLKPGRTCRERTTCGGAGRETPEGKYMHKSHFIPSIIDAPLQREIPSERQKVEALKKELYGLKPESQENAIISCRSFERIFIDFTLDPD